MAENDITIERSLEQIKKGISDIGAASKAIDKDLKAVNNGLKFDSSNTELLAQKQDLLSKKLENSKVRSQELSNAIEELNRIKAENGQLTDGQTKLLATYTQQLKEQNIEIIGLTGATQQQTEVTKEAEIAQQSFSQSMTEFQSNLKAVKSVMGGVISAYELMGGDKDSAMGRTMVQGQKVIATMTGLASAGKLLKDGNTLVAGSFSNLALSAGVAFGAFALVDGLLNKLDGDSRKVAGGIAILAGAVTAGAVAWMAYHGTMTLGVAIPVILASLAVGAAGIKAITSKAKAASAEMADIGSISIPTSTPSIPSTPSVPTYSGGSSGGGSTSATYISQGGLTEGQMESASYRGFMRAIVETGLNDPKFIGSAEINGRELIKLTFQDWIDEYKRRGGNGNQL